jgi:predicted acylesterase/phospholipase RssA/CRP-like cAMP-binding protein
MAQHADSRNNVIEVLRASPIFGKLKDEVIQSLANVLQLQKISGGHTVVKEGEEAEEMLFLISGGLRVSRRDSSGQLMLYNEIRPGMSFGESGLILRQPRAADVTAVRDSILAVLHRQDFETMIVKHPLELNQVFVRAIYNYLRHAEEFAERRHAQTFAVVPLHKGAGADQVASQLALAFSKLGRTHHLEPPASADAVKYGRPLPAQSESEMAAYQDALEEESKFLVYEAQATPTDWTMRAFRQADQVVFVVSADHPKAVSELEQRLRDQPDYSMKRMHLVVLHSPLVTQPSDITGWRKDKSYERVYPIRAKRTEDFERLARFLTGTAVGVVLGGGGARGFAHIGILRALAEANIPVDLVGGNSMGALIGAQYACGKPLDQIVSDTREFASGGERLTLPVISLVSGKRVARDLKKMFGDTQIENLWIPFFAAACNLTRGNTTVQDKGSLWRAVLASNSPAGLFPPVIHRGDMLVDGAILENVPVDAMRMRLGTPLERRRGNGTIIAIDVDVQELMAVDPTLKRLSIWSTLKGYFSAGKHPSPSIADILYRAGHIGGLSQRGRTIAQADHYLEPPVAEFSMMSYRKADDIADVGYAYAKKKIPQWNRKE